MAYQISDDCISCGACAAECPVSAISEGDGKFVIDADVCLECVRGNLPRGCACPGISGFCRFFCFCTNKKEHAESFGFGRVFFCPLAKAGR